MFLAGRNHMITNRSLISTMRMFHEMGYGGLELSLVRGNSTVLAWDYLDDYVIDKVNETSMELGFPITALACHQNYVVNEDAYEAQKMLIKKAHKYHTDVLIVSTFVPYEERENHPELYTLLLERTRSLCDLAEYHGVNVAIEVEPNQLFHNLKIFLDVADQLNSPAFKLNFDVGHIYLSENDLYEAIEKTKDFIVYSHIDNMCMGEHCHKLPWDGEIHLQPVYRKLKETGYNGAVSLDIYLQDYEKVAPKCLEYINKEIFDKI